MSKSMLENLAVASDTMVRLFAVLAAISALVFFVSNRQIQRTRKAVAEKAGVESEQQRSAVEAEVSRVQSRLTEVQKDNARLAGELEAEKQARLEVQKRLGPRGVLPTSASAMIETLAPFVGQRVNFAYFTDLETARFAERVLDVLRRAGWKPQVCKLKSIQPMYGVHCGAPNPADPAFKALSEALQVVDKHLATQDADAAATLRSIQPQLTDQPWVLITLKRPPLRMHSHVNGVDGQHPAGDEGD